MSNVVEHWNEENDRKSKNFLWNYCNNAANLLKTSIYQLAPTTSKKCPQTINNENLNQKKTSFQHPRLIHRQRMN